MTLSDSSTTNCKFCDAATPMALRNCSSCNRDLGVPNVRICATDEERSAIDNRKVDAQEHLSQKNREAIGAAFANHVNDHARVVVAVPATVARNLLQNTTSLYTNYEKLTAAGARKPAPIDDDKQRQTVGSAMFGTYAHQIIYGALSSNGVGVRSYGPISFTLKNRMIDWRTSLLEKNSYLIYASHKDAAPFPPAGLRAPWNRRADLALVKHFKALTDQMTESEFPSLLLSQGNDRSDDQFIEAHIYGSFDSQAIESIEADLGGLNRTERLDAKIVLELAGEQSKTAAPQEAGA